MTIFVCLRFISFISVRFNFSFSSLHFCDYAYDSGQLEGLYFCYDVSFFFLFHAVVFYTIFHILTFFVIIQFSFSMVKKEYSILILLGAFFSLVSTFLDSCIGELLFSFFFSISTCFIVLSSHPNTKNDSLNIIINIININILK